MQSSDSEGEGLEDLNLDDGIPDIPDMNFIEKVKVKKPEPKANEYYIKNPGYMDSDSLLNKSQTSKKNVSPKFRFAQTNSPIAFEFLNPEAGSTDPLKPAIHYEEIRKKGTSNGILLNNRRRTVNFETGQYPEMYLELRKD